ncbi:MAG: J domain-containing protein [Gammaproteobacteria bacterium]|nr:J domain-containing protein [Gammaproteobacteria bacterium]
MRLPARVQSPEERELELKRHELAALKADLVEQELLLSTLQAELAAFEGEYLRVVGVRYAELDDLRARIAEIRVAKSPTDSAAQAAASRARATAEASAAEAHGRACPQPTPSFDPPSEIKTLYRTIARRLHPDLAATDDERTRRHEWMAKVNAAYRRQDSEALAALLSAWEASPESVSGTGVPSDLVRVIRQIAQVRRRLDDIRRDIQALQAGELYALHQKCNERSAAHGSLLEELAASLDEQIAAARQDLAVLEAEAP